jgi:succinate dehydrogenase / fumarate reductase flavoprotein subunit
MQNLVGIVRNEKDMASGLDLIEHMKESAAKIAVMGNREYNPGWHTVLDLHNLLTVAEAVTRSGLSRKESRGAHFREDFPDRDAALGKVNTILRKGPDGEMQVTQASIPDMPDELKQIIEEIH